MPERLWRLRRKQPPEQSEDTMRGVINGIFAWGQHPLYSEGTLWEWGAGLVLILILAFLWTTVLAKIRE